MTATEALAAALADRYAIERLIGEGGMATVYLARDIRHNRRVALKVLRPDLGAVVGVERFLAEIQVTANLQHPNLLPLFDSGAAGNWLFYVMPYVQGESLRARLDREKQLPVDEAIRLATAIGGALDYAHRQGVIHRDLKPENVLLQEGQPLVADFGIALAVSNAGGTRITQTGLSLGTPHYMSPEQATGDRVIDGRTDIYSLGALTYEMLTGEPPHVGSTSQAIIARVLTERPRSIRASRPSVPEHVEAAVEHALEKLPADRWATAREFSEALAGLRPVTRSASWSTSGITSAPVGRERRFRRPAIREIVGWGLAAVGLAAAAWTSTRPDTVRPMTQLTVDLPDSIVANGGMIAGLPSVAISSDSRTIAYAGSRRTTLAGITPGSVKLFVRQMDGFVTRELAGTEGASNPVFSPDGDWLAFIDGTRTLKRVPVTGGAGQTIADSVFDASWADDGSIIFSRPSGLWAIDAGARERRVVKTDTAKIPVFRHLAVLPGATYALAQLRGSGTWNLVRIDLRSGQVTGLKLTGQTPRYVPGYLLYMSEADVLSAVPFSRKGEITGEPIRVAESVASLTNGGMDYAVSGDGTIVFRWTRGSRLEPTELAFIDRKGKVSVIRKDGQHYDQPRASPDGRSVVLRIGGSAFNNGDLWVLELASGALSRLTTGNKSYRPSWSRDGTRIFYMTGAPLTSVVMSKPWDGSGMDSVILRRAETAEFSEGPPGGWSAIRTYALRDILIVRAESIASATPRPFVTGLTNETDIALSPSGKLLAYQSDESGRYEVYVRPVPGPGPRVPVSVDGGSHAVWARDGRTLYFRSGASVMAASITDQPTVTVARRDSLFAANLATDGVNLTVLHDGRFVAALATETRTTSPFVIAVLSNWQSLFAKSNAAGNK